MAVNKTPYKPVGEKKTISYAVKDLLGRGGFGSVHPGSLKGRNVAVKRILIVGDEEQREIKLQAGLEHENVLKILEVDEDDTFRYIVLELCAGTLGQFIRNEYKGPMLPTDEQVLYQIACGVHYIHSMKLVHRDIKPENILISLTNPVVMKVSDFGLSKATNSRGTFTLTGIKGTENWLAPEILNKERGSVQSDIFATGCVFFYFIKKGTHPFGEEWVIPINIRDGNPVNLTKLEKTHFAHGVIENMIKNKMEERTSLTQVIETLKNQSISKTPILNDQFKAIKRPFPLISGWCFSRFHPTEPVLACGSDLSSVTILKGANGSVSFFNWRTEQEFKGKTQERISAIEWNVDGTQLAAGGVGGTIIVWSYPSGRLLFKMKGHSKLVKIIFWNPFSQDVLATRVYGHDKQELVFWNTRSEKGDAEKAKRFLTLKCNDVGIRSVAWISANQIAIGFFNGIIEIWEMDEDKGTSRVVKKLHHSDHWVTVLQWNERTKYLASCSTDKWIKIWSMDSDRPVHTLQLDSSCWELAWRPNLETDNNGGFGAARKAKENFTIACKLTDQSILVYNPLEENEENKKRILPQKHSCDIWSLSFSPDGRFLASTDYGDELLVWSTETWLPVFTCQNDGSTLSWMSTDSSAVLANKLASRSMDKVFVIEQSSSQDVQAAQRSDTNIPERGKKRRRAETAVAKGKRTKKKITGP